MRLQATDSATNIYGKLTELVVEFGDELTADVVQRLERLREKHSECLSEIPPHFGSNKNERLHREVFVALKILIRIFNKKMYISFRFDLCSTTEQLSV